MTASITLDGNSLIREHVVAIANGARVVLDAEQLRKVQRTADFVVSDAIRLEEDGAAAGVYLAGHQFDKATTPTVPRLAAGLPRAVQISRRKATIEDLPLVPVTAATVWGWAAKKIAA